ncbi:MAG: DUF4411 family protein [Bacteroidales bacterium]|nr:DUF4411 family protein [Bacteroidales bacterium]
MKKYILDTNVYIEASKGYYHPDIVPVYWDILKDLGQKELINSPKQVRDEIKIRNRPSQTENTTEQERFLYDWSRLKGNECFLKNDLNGIEVFFRQVQTVYEKVKLEHTKILQTKNKRFRWPKKEPVSDEDMFVIATVLYYQKYVPTHDYVLVTKETFDLVPRHFKPMKIPHLCKELGIEWMDDFKFIMEIGIKFDSSNYTYRR